MLITTLEKVIQMLDNHIAKYPNMKTELPNIRAFIDSYNSMKHNYLETLIQKDKEIADLKDKLHHRNMQIKDLKAELEKEKSQAYKDRQESFRLAAMLGRMGYNLKGEAIR